MSSALKSKLGYSSPFDEALSKPLISSDAGQNRQAESSARSAYSSRLEMTEPPSSAGGGGSSTGLGLSSRTSNSNYKPPLPDQAGQQQQPQADSSLTLMTTNELDQVDIDAALLQERHAESARVARSMQQIHEITQDLAHLVQSHQETIDTIESDAYDIHDNAERGVSHLEKAKAAMKDATRNEGFMRVFFAVMATGGLMIAIVLLLEAFY